MPLYVWESSNSATFQPAASGATAKPAFRGLGRISANPCGIICTIHRSEGVILIKLHPNLPALPIQPTAWRWLQDYGVELVVRDGYSTRGGGAWWPGRKLVELLTVQEEAAIHELAHAWWQERRLVGTTAAELMVACVKLSEETDPRYRRATELANHYVYGLRNQRDENSPTGWWMGMYVGLGADWEIFAGLASGVMGDLRLLPPYVRRFYEGFFDEPAG